MKTTYHYDGRTFFQITILQYIVLFFMFPIWNLLESKKYYRLKWKYEKIMIPIYNKVR